MRETEAETNECRIEYKLAFYSAQKCFIFNATLNRLSYSQQCVIHSLTTQNTFTWSHGIACRQTGNQIAFRIYMFLWSYWIVDLVCYKMITFRLIRSYRSYISIESSFFPPPSNVCSIISNFFSGACPEPNEFNAGSFNYLNRNKSKIVSPANDDDDALFSMFSFLIEKMYSPPSAIMIK